MTLNEAAKRAHDTARAKGFWDGDYVGDVSKKLLLIHSEVSEAAECVRKGDVHLTYEPHGTINAPVPKPIGLPSELADVLIRTLDLMHYLNLDVAAVVKDKMTYNDTRPTRHGGKRF